MASRWIGITGAANGLGKEFTTQLIKQGFSIIALDRDESGLEKLRQEFKGKVTGYSIDIGDQVQYLKTLEDIYQTHGIPKWWINNAGIADNRPFQEMGLDHWQKMIQVNFLGVITACQFWQAKSEEESREITIINMGSVAGHVPAPFMSSYVTVKHGIVGLTRSLALEQKLTKGLVRYVLVSPGFVKTDLIEMGKERGMPEYFSFMLAESEKCVSEIVAEIKKNKSEIFPTLNGKVMKRIHALSPRVAEVGSKVLASKNWKQLLGIEKINF